MSSKSAFSASDWNLLKSGAHWALTALTAADDSGFLARKKEASALTEALKNYKTHSQLVKDIIAESDKPAPEVEKGTLADAEAAYRQIADILDNNASRLDAENVRDFYLAMATQISVAVNETLLNREGTEVSEEEAAAIANLTKALRATLADRQSRANKEFEAKQQAAEAKRLEAEKQRLEEEKQRLEEERKETERMKAEAEAAAKAQAAAEAEAARARIQAEMEARQAERRAEQEAARVKAAQEAAKRAQEAAEAARLAEEAAKAAEAEEAAAKLYVVQPGDNLWKIAAKLYGNGNRWKEIFEANKETIKDPNLIRAGMELNIP
ncbi:MAG TPA: LysM peptidoglycan-binding domain-containing protein [Anaerolineae bacterium]|nr:LysM peptidoglycan-binding domain-containing protein [Anaerolineae bacterium]